jgi:hypothetical protein
VKDALLVVLTSPQFLFLVETSKSPAPEPLDSYELASKLSYFLWNGPPDGKTLQLAASAALPGQLDAEVGRMIGDPRFSRFASEFTSQWLNLDKFQVVEVDHKKFPKLTLNARSQLKQEPIEFVKYLLRNNLPVGNLIQSISWSPMKPSPATMTLAIRPKAASGSLPSPMRGAIWEALSLVAILAACRTAANRIP